jgi:hypothetical protein
MDNKEENLCRSKKIPVASKFFKSVKNNFRGSRIMDSVCIIHYWPRDTKKFTRRATSFFMLADS